MRTMSDVRPSILRRKKKTKVKPVGKNLDRAFVTFYATHEQKQNMVDIAYYHGMSLSSFLRSLVLDYMERNKEKYNIVLQNDPISWE